MDVYFGLLSHISKICITPDKFSDVGSDHPIRYLDFYLLKNFMFIKEVINNWLEML
jgi:hypothetical protein